MPHFRVVSKEEHFEPNKFFVFFPNFNTKILNPGIKNVIATAASCTPFNLAIGNINDCPINYLTLPKVSIGVSWHSTTVKQPFWEILKSIIFISTHIWCTRSACAAGSNSTLNPNKYLFLAHFRTNQYIPALPLMKPPHNHLPLIKSNQQFLPLFIILLVLENILVFESSIFSVVHLY